MAQRTIVELVDDLDGGTAEETVIFGLDGRQYEIDLSAKNAEALRETLASYITVARRSGGRRHSAGTRRATTARPSGEPNDANVIREWARSQGYEVNARGRIPAHLREAYAAR